MLRGEQYSHWMERHGSINRRDHIKQFHSLLPSRCSSVYWTSLGASKYRGLSTMASPLSTFASSSSSSSLSPSSGLKVSNPLVYRLRKNPAKVSFRSRGLNTRSAAPAGNSNNGVNEEEGRVRIDRRELVAGSLLAAAGSLWLPESASANPIAPPSLKGCKLASIDRGQLSSKVYCCLIDAKEYKDFVFDKRTKPRIRPAAHLVDENYIAKYNLAYEKMKALPGDDPRSFANQADVHCAFCNNAYKQFGSSTTNLQIHFNALFLPWHRWYLYYHERILGSLIGDDNFALPYWAWDDQVGGNRVPEMFKRVGSAIYDSKRDPEKMGKLLTLNRRSTATTDEQIIQENLNEMRVTVRCARTPDLFMGKVISSGVGQNSSNAGTLENGPHTSVHSWVGDNREQFDEDMGNFYSAGKDPLFYSHHCNVDRIWDLWKTLPGKRRKDHTEPDFLSSSFYFYDEKKDLMKVNVKDSLSSKNLGIGYQTLDSAKKWIDFGANPVSNSPASTKGVEVLGPKVDGKAGVELKEKRVFAVDRKPKSERTEAEDEEVLVLQGLQVPTNGMTQLNVFINLPDAGKNTPTNCLEYVGSFNAIPQVSKSNATTRTTDVRLPVCEETIDKLKLQKSKNIVVTLISTIDGRNDVAPVTLAGLNIEYV